MRMFYMERICSRCGKGPSRVAMSYMNTDVICDKCNKIEQKHPMYNSARLAKVKACKSGDFDYPGLFAEQKYPFD